MLQCGVGSLSPLIRSLIKLSCPISNDCKLLGIFYFYFYGRMYKERKERKANSHDKKHQRQANTLSTESTTPLKKEKKIPENANNSIKSWTYPPFKCMLKQQYLLYIHL